MGTRRRGRAAHRVLFWKSRRGFGGRRKSRHTDLRRSAGCRRLACEPLEERTLLSASGPAPLWFGDAAPGLQADFLSNGARLELLGRTDEGISGRLSLPGVLSDTLMLKRGEFTTLEVPGWGWAGKVGQSGLPALHTSFTIPNRTRVIADYTIEQTAGFRCELPVLPVQPLEEEGLDGTNFAYDEDYFQGVGVHGVGVPERNILTVGLPAVARDRTVVFVEIAPFSYDPVTGGLSVVTELSFSLGFRETLGRVASGTRLDLPPAACAADYLIVTANDFYEEVLPLARWKQQKGFRTYVATMEEIGHTAADVREYISGAYHTGVRTSYVLLVGDHPGFPDIAGPELDIEVMVPSNNVGDQYEDFGKAHISDLPYACVDGADNLPDLTIGRLPVRTDAEAAVVIEKILHYDRDPDRPLPGQRDWDNWYDDALIAAYYQDKDNDHVADRYFMETAMYLRDHLIGPDRRNPTWDVQTALTASETEGQFRYREEPLVPPFVHRISVLDEWGEPLDPPYNVPQEVVSLWTSQQQGTADVIAAIKDGVGLVQHRDHGSPDGWDHPPFYVDPHLGQLSNGVKTPVVFSTNCMSGAFNYADGDSFAEAMLKLPLQSPPGTPNGGAVGMIAATRNSFTPLNDQLTHGIYSSFWPDGDRAYDPYRDPREIADNPYPPSMRPAEALNFGKFYMAWYTGPQPEWQAGVAVEYHIFHWFGDPEMMLRTDAPKKLSVIHSGHFAVGTSSDYRVFVTQGPAAVEGAQVCISKPDSDDYWVGTTGASGMVTFHGLAPHEAGQYDIVVTAFNAAPYTGTINSGVLPGVLVIDATPGNGRVNGQEDHVRLVRNGDHVDVYLGDNPYLYWSEPLASIEKIFVAGSGDEDKLTVVLTADGSPIPRGGIHFGAAGEITDGDSLVVQTDGLIADVTYAASGRQAGDLTIDGQTISIAGVEQVDVLPGQLTNLRVQAADPAAHHALLRDDAGQIDNVSALEIDAASVVLTFTNPGSSLVVNLGGGDDTLIVDSLDPAFSRNAKVEIDLGTGNDLASARLVEPAPADISVYADRKGTDVVHLTGVGAGETFRAEHEREAPDWARLSGASSVTATAFSRVFLHQTGALETVEPDVEFELIFGSLHWDGLGDGQWDHLEGGYSRWLDSRHNRVAAYPNDPFTDAVVRADRVTIPADCGVRDLAIEHATVDARGRLLLRDLTLVDGTLITEASLAVDNFTFGEGARIRNADPAGDYRWNVVDVTINASLAATGNLATLSVFMINVQLRDAARYECRIGAPNDQLGANDRLFAGLWNNRVFLDGALDLRAIDKLYPPEAPPQQQYGHQTRRIIEFTQWPVLLHDVVGNFAAVPDAQPPQYGLPGDETWGRGHLGNGVFLTRRTGDYPPVHPGITYQHDSVEVHLFQACPGDTNGDGYLETRDIQALLAANSFLNHAGGPWQWWQGDFTGDGLVDGQDISAILATNLWDTPQPYAGGDPDDPAHETVGPIDSAARGVHQPLAMLSPTSRVVARHTFYNNSAFDGNDPAANRPDDAAIARDKKALLPGGTAELSNYAGYSRGINGIMVDIAAAAGVPTADDFQFKVGSDDNAKGWVLAPQPTSVTVRENEGLGGSDRVTLIWDDNLIQNQWLQVTVLPGGNTGLAEADVFYFGNAIGDCGDSATHAKVNAVDMLAARDNPRTFLDPAPIDFPFDFDRDGRVNAVDMLIARNNSTHFLNALRLITVPGSKSIGKSTADLAEESAHDTGVRMTAGAGPQGGKPLERLAWLHESQATGRQKRPAATGNPARENLQRLPPGR